MRLTQACYFTKHGELALQLYNCPSLKYSFLWFHLYLISMFNYSPIELSEAVQRSPPRASSETLSTYSTPPHPPHSTSPLVTSMQLHAEPLWIPREALQAIEICCCCCCFVCFARNSRPYWLQGHYAIATCEKLIYINLLWASNTGTAVSWCYLMVAAAEHLRLLPAAASVLPAWKSQWVNWHIWRRLS